MSGLERLDGDSFSLALTSGIHRVMGEQELLNRINVFPVADADTGTNLSLSLSSALGILQTRGQDLGVLLAAIADALLDGARGNSGAILAQFFQGMSDAAGDIKTLNVEHLAKAVNLGSEYAHDALSKPREGTVLSVIAAFAESVDRQQTASPELGYAAIFRVACEDVDKALQNTPNQLAVLKSAGVVDAGAKGFAELVNGMADYLVRGEVTPLPTAGLVDAIEAPVEFSAADNASQFRFCTECIVIGEDIDRRKLREALAKIGDSLVLAGSKQKAKIHIHVDDPDAVFSLARSFGELSGEKADDMHRQQHATHVANKSFAVITDSGSDIVDEDMERLDIHMIPCRIQFGNRGYMDKLSITTDEFYHEIQHNPQHPTTSQPAPGDFRRQYQFLASHFSDVLAITLTSAASGTHEAARAAAKRCAGPGRIHVIDSLNASTGEGQLTVLAAECAAAGMSVEETIALLEATVPTIRTFALVKDLRFAVRGGRIPGWTKTLADIFRLTPILAVKPSGHIRLGSVLLGRFNRVARFAKFIAAEIDGDEPVEIGIGQAICPDDAQALAVELKRRIPAIARLKICNLGTALGVHAGPGSLIVSYRPLSPSESPAATMSSSP